MSNIYIQNIGKTELNDYIATLISDTFISTLRNVEYEASIRFEKDGLAVALRICHERAGQTRLGGSVVGAVLKYADMINLAKVDLVDKYVECFALSMIAVAWRDGLLVDIVAGDLVT